MGDALVMTGSLLFVAGYIWGVCVAFGRSAVQGISRLLVPMLLLFDLLTYPRRMWLPVLCYVGGFALLVAGVQLNRSTG